MIGAGIAQRNQDTISLALRCFAYQALSQLGERIPSVLQDDLEIPEYLFQTLATEAPGVRASLQQSLSTLSSAYAKVEGEYSYSRHNKNFYLSSHYSSCLFYLRKLKPGRKQPKHEIFFLLKDLYPRTPLHATGVPLCFKKKYAREMRNLW